MANDDTRFAAYPSVVMFEKPNATSPAKGHLLWGDWLRLHGPRRGDWYYVHARGEDGWIRENEIQKNRLLEVNFVDIGQGDGCLIVTPDDKWLVVDAGESDNMYRFLNWRFGRFKNVVKFKSFIITHPDKDHYGGFKKLLTEKNVSVGALYHNGIVDRKGPKSLGPEKKIGDIIYLDDIITDMKQLKRLLSSEKEKGSRKPYPALLRTAVESGRIDEVSMLGKLSQGIQYVPGYDEKEELKIEVLSPIPEKGPHGKWRLRRFGNDGKTKNGHSIVLMLCYKHTSILLGGDLNVPAENYLLHYYTKMNPEKVIGYDLRKLVSKARAFFQADIAKSCHHGSPDFTELFMEAVNPIVTVVSSGDEESYAHPRPDTLGAIGRYGRGMRPLIFSTELARSSRETIKHPNEFREEIRKLMEKAYEGKTKGVRDNVRQRLYKLTDQIERSVAVYGMITLRTDGEKVVIAQKLEKPRSKKSKWDIHQLEPGAGGKLAYVSKHVALPKGNARPE
jgi:beta-lactamase superfamily II metal-dependent hydrolase